MLKFNFLLARAQLTAPRDNRDLQLAIMSIIILDNLENHNDP